MKNGIKALLASLALMLPTTSPATADEDSALRTWTNEDGRQMDAALIELRGDVATFRRNDGRTYEYPVNRLSDEDRRYISENPPSGEESEASNAPGSPEGPESRRDRSPSEVAEALEGTLVTSTGARRTSRLRDYESVENADYYAFYYSASWCGPCRQFTPVLVRKYNELKRNHDNFELIFVSSDRNRNDMAEYMSDYSMPWPAIDYNRRGRVEPAAQNRPRAIPTLIVLDRDGNVVAPSGGSRAPARQVLNEFESLLNDS